MVGIDPSLKGVLAARRVSRQLGIEGHFLVADGRFLPFPDGSFSRVFSYSVLQHLSKENVQIVLPEIRRVLKTGGEAMVQLPNVFGLRSLYHEIRRGFRETRDFEVRYWTIPELKSTFSRLIGPVERVGGRLLLAQRPSQRCRVHAPSLPGDRVYVRVVAASQRTRARAQLRCR